MSSATTSKKDLKKSVSAEECRKKRSEASVEIRKNKRNERLQKRRAMMQMPAMPESPVKLDAETSNLSEIYKNLISSDYEKVLAATHSIRKMLSRPTDPPVVEVIETGAVPKLIEFLKCNEKPALQFQALWALTNIGSTEHTSVIVEAGIVPLVVPLLFAPTADIREQAVWCLGNIAGGLGCARNGLLVCSFWF